MVFSPFQTVINANTFFIFYHKIIFIFIKNDIYSKRLNYINYLYRNTSYINKNLLYNNDKKKIP